MDFDKEFKIRRKEYPGHDKGLQVKETDGVVTLAAPLLEEQTWLRHGFSTRLGGVSEGDCYSMNLGFGRESNEENVRENYRRIAGAVGFKPEDMVFTYQTHTNVVRKVTEDDRGKGFARPRDYQDVDGLITDVLGIALTIFAADCVPLLIADKRLHVIGASHSGWRGTIADIGGETIRRMHEEYGTRAEDCVCVIGPSICGDCYEVSPDVGERFREAYSGALADMVCPVREPDKCSEPTLKYSLNLWEACRQNFLRAGVPEEQILMTDICTCCNPELLFSHRASQGKRGALAAFLQIQGQSVSDARR